MNKISIQTISPYDTGNSLWIYMIPCDMVLDVCQSKFSNALTTSNVDISLGPILLNFSVKVDIINKIKESEDIDNVFKQGLNLWFPIFKSREIPLFMFKGNMIIKTTQDLGDLILVLKDKTYYTEDTIINLYDIQTSSSDGKYLISSERYPNMIISLGNPLLYEENRQIGKIPNKYVFPDKYKLSTNSFIKLANYDNSNLPYTQVFNKIHINIATLTLQNNWI